MSPINTGIIESYAALDEEGGVTARLFYDPVLTNGVVVSANQPLVDRDGAALWVENTADGDASVTLTGPSGELDLLISGPGVTTRTAQQILDATGIANRADATNGFTLAGE